MENIILASGIYQEDQHIFYLFLHIFSLGDFPFCIDISHTYSYSHLDFHTRHLFIELAYQVAQVPRDFDTRFLPFYTTCAIRCTCQNPNKFLAPLPGNFFIFGKLVHLQVSILYLLLFYCFCEYLFLIHICLLLLNWVTAVLLVLYMNRSPTCNLVPLDLEIEATLRRNRAERRRKLLQDRTVASILEEETHFSDLLSPDSPSSRESAT